MGFRESQRFISLKLAAKISGYNPDYIGWLIRKGKIEGRKVYSGASWKTTKNAILVYKTRKKALLQSQPKEPQEKQALKKYISLKKAAEISGYTSDYISWLIRKGKILGKKVYTGVSWQTTAEAIKKYQTAVTDIKQESSRNSYPRLESAKKIVTGIFGLSSKSSKVFNIGWRFSLAALIIFFLISGFFPVKFLQGSLIEAIAGGGTKTVDFYPTISYGDWQNSQNIQGPPDVLPTGSLDSFSEANSAVYKKGPLTLAAEGFSSEESNWKEIKNKEKGVNEEKGARGVTSTVSSTTDAGAVDTETGVASPTSTGFTTSSADNIGSSTDAGVGNTSGTVSGQPSQNQEQEQQQEENENNKGAGRKLLEIINPARNAFLGGVKKIFGFQAKAQADEEQIFRSAKIKISFAIGTRESGFSQEEQAIGYERQKTGDRRQDLSMKVGGVWNKVKSFFGSLVERAVLIAKAAQSSTSSASSANLTVPEGGRIEGGFPQSGLEAQTKQEEEKSEILPGLDAKIIIWYSLDGKVWQKLDTISDSSLSNALNGGYFSYDAPFLKNSEDIKNLKIKFEGAIGGESNIVVYLDSVWIEAIYGGQKPEEKAIEIISNRNDFQLDEEPEFKFQYLKKNRGLFSSIGESLNLIDYWDGVNIQVRIKNPKGKILELSPEFSFENNGEFLLKLPRRLFQNGGRPGLYKLILKIEENGETKELERGFSWGVLAINTNKSIYLPGEKAYLQMGVLDEKGHTICDADLTLEITAPDGTRTILTTAGGSREELRKTEQEEKQQQKEEIQQKEDRFASTTASTTSPGAGEDQTQQGGQEEDGQAGNQEQPPQPSPQPSPQPPQEKKQNGPVRRLLQKILGTSIAKADAITAEGTIYKSPECGPGSVTYTPDYYAYYNVLGPGIYQLNLTATTKNGAYSISDSFETRESVPFDIERIGPTRIYPPADYEMRMIVKVNQGFVGEVIETVPSSFKILNQELRIKNQESENFIIRDSSFVIQEQGDGEKALIWQNVVLKRGDQLEIRYTFYAPDVSPYLYLLGPLKFAETEPLQLSDRQQDKGILEKAKEGVTNIAKNIKEGARRLFDNSKP